MANIFSSKNMLKERANLNPFALLEFILTIVILESVLVVDKERGKGLDDNLQVKA